MSKLQSIFFTIIFCISCLSNADNETNTTDKLEIDQFNISLSFGLGQRNPFILGQDNLRLYLAPSITYYSNHLFFDNGTLGYTFNEQSKWAISVITELNPYAKYFNQNHISNRFLEFSEAVPDSSLEELLDPPYDESSLLPDDNNYQSITQNITTKLIEKKRMSLDGGVQFNYFIGSNQRVDLRLLNDLSKLHNGFRLDLNWNLGFQFNDFGKTKWRGNLALGLDYIDASSANYYFGFYPDELAISYIAPYKLGHSVIPSITLNLNKKMTDNVSLVLYLKHQRLSSDITNSPVITSSQINTSFLGLTYAF